MGYNNGYICECDNKTFKGSLHDWSEQAGHEGAVTTWHYKGNKCTQVV